MVFVWDFDLECFIVASNWDVLCHAGREPLVSDDLVWPKVDGDDCCNWLTDRPCIRFAIRLVSFGKIWRWSTPSGWWSKRLRFWSKVKFQCRFGLKCPWVASIPANPCENPDDDIPQQMNAALKFHVGYFESDNRTFSLIFTQNSTNQLVGRSDTFHWKKSHE